MQCSHLFALTSFLIPATNDEPLVRFGLIHPCPEQCKVVACIFSAYHAVKRKVRESQFTHSGNDIDLGSGTSLRNNWTLYAQTFGAEASVHAISTRAFSVQKIISFMLHGGVHRPELAFTDSVQLSAHHDDFLAPPEVQATHTI